VIADDAQHNMRSDGNRPFLSRMKMYGRKIYIYIYERTKRSIGKRNNSRRKATGDRGYKQQETARRDLCTHRVWSLTKRSALRRALHGAGRARHNVRHRSGETPLRGKCLPGHHVDWDSTYEVQGTELETCRKSRDNLGARADLQSQTLGCAPQSGWGG
jgi:hypothetical protein